MSASSNVASSTLTRSHTFILTVATIATCLASYSLYRSYAYEYERSSLPGSGLHRSNAVHRRRRRNTTGEGDDEATPIFIDDAIENDGEGNIVATALTDGETVVDDQGLQGDSPWIEVPQTFQEHQRNGQNIVQLLFRVSEDATRRNAYVHRGCACNSCGTVPIRGIRYRCANCVDYDLCEGCESQGMHIKTHIFYKIKVPASSFGPRHIQPVWYSGDPDSVTRVLSREILTKLSRETGFERPELDAYWEQWTFMANTDWRDDPDEIHLAMDRKTFERCLVPSGGYRHSAPNLMFDRMFSFYDTNKDDLIGFAEFLHGIAYRKKKDKWSKIFEGYDIDGDGFVDRKDFLRMFRSYYVLYRQMHRDMLEGMAEQQMSSIDAHRLVNSRQPLSSAFGQDGRYPRAPDPRTGEGKVARPNGDFDIADGKGVINESSNDTGNREDIFRRDTPGPSNGQWDRNASRNAAYWETMLNPPENIRDMPRVLNNFERNQHRNRERRTLADLLIPSEPPNVDPTHWRSEGNDDETDDSFERDSNPESDRAWPPNFIGITDEDAEAIEGPGSRVEDVQRANRRAVIAQAIFREGAHRDVYDRWQRRQFYTDEEEGAVPPADWKEDDDILANVGITGESSKVSRPVHSRSSSKVRFAEDMDDFDTRSNPSTSSRSVPERWGGMEIPDAEKDAGKEILYQVTQQAFNELLDPLFKDKEDLAIESGASQIERDQFRAMYSTPEFEAWALELEAKTAKKRAERAAQNSAATYTPTWPSFPEVELEQIRERPLEDLLAATGYQVEDVPHNLVDSDDSRELQDIPTPELTRTSPTTLAPTATGHGGVPDDLENGDDGRALQDMENPPIQTSPMTMPMIPVNDVASSPEPAAPNPTPNNPAPTSPIVLSATVQEGQDSALLTLPSILPPDFDADLEYRDPTLPQFRPNTTEQHNFDGSSRHAYSLPALPHGHPVTAYANPNEENIDQNPAGPSNTKSLPLGDFPAEETPGRDRLYQLWKCDRAAKEALERGGWARLNFVEFETLVKRFSKEGKANQMDYLGSWIEFCIP
jgi:Ca2+-binding EF-hand superfamily protein